NKRFTYWSDETIEVEAELNPSTRTSASPSDTTVAIQMSHRGISTTRTRKLRMTKTDRHGQWAGRYRLKAPSNSFGAYLISARVAGSGADAASSQLAVEVLRNYKDLSKAIRMATVCELYPDRDPEVLADRLVDARINLAWLRNIFSFGQYNGPSKGRWQGEEGCQLSDIGRPVEVFASHLRKFIKACHDRGIKTIVYANLRNINENIYKQVSEAGRLGPHEVDLDERRWPYPYAINFRARAECRRWEKYLIDEIKQGMVDFGYDGYFFDNTSYANFGGSEARMAKRILKATKRALSDQFAIVNPGPPLSPGQWRNPRDVEILRWPEVGCALMEVEGDQMSGCETPEDIIRFGSMFRAADDTKTPILYIHDPTRRSPGAHLLRLGHSLAGKCNEDLCCGQSGHDGALFFETCPVSAALTRSVYSGLAECPEFIEPGPILAGVKVSGLKDVSVMAYDGLNANGNSITVMIANRDGWNKPLRNTGYYWDDDTPKIRSSSSIRLLIPVPSQRKIIGCWLLRPEDCQPISWSLAPGKKSISIVLDEVTEFAAIVVRFAK
ncbi:MAG TPA: glycoside hydrolase family 66 protein, partial [Tepidisphaeraceae bacterium]|nr:glycoside hydrolase family 66 protein [Tepidisphaeraceae bacterium]